MKSRLWLLWSAVLFVLVACGSQETDDLPTAGAATTITSFGVNPGAVPSNVAAQFSWSVEGQGLTCTLDVDNNGVIDYTVTGCTSGSRVVHTYGVTGSYLSRLWVSGQDGRSEEKTTVVTVTPPNTPPAIPSLTPSTPPDTSNPLAVRFTWVVSDLDSDVTRCRFDANSDGVWEFDDLCSGLPVASSVSMASVVTYSYDYVYPLVGNYMATLEAVDAYVSTRTSVKVRVPHNRSPVIERFLAEATGDLKGQVEFKVSDPDGDPVRCVLEVEGIGKFNFVNCSELSRVYTFPSQGTYQVSLSASDGRSSTRRVANLTFRTTLQGFSYLPTNFNQGFFGCAISPAGTAYCWGQADQMGNGGVDNEVPGPVSMPAGVAFSALTTGQYHICALSSKGEAYCWGDSADGRLGVGESPPTYLLVPTAVVMPEGVTFKSITAGSTYTCALTAAGSVGGEGKAYCWGDGSSGQTGQGYEVSCSLTVQSRAGTSSCSVVQSQTGKVTPNLPPSPTPRSGPLWKPAPVDGNRTYIDIAAGGSHTCGIESTGDVYCWGADDYGSLGDNDDSHPGGSVFSPLAVDTPAGKSFSRITGGTGYSCALTSSSSAGGAGQAYCWGRGSNGALGNGEEENYDLAVQVILPSGVRFAQISGGSSHVCALSLEGAAYCWGKGDDNDGRLGLNDEDNAENRLTPAPVVMPAGVTFSAIAAADDFTCALQSEVGNLYCWGYAYMYGLANGDNQVNRFVPYPAVMPTF